MGWSPVHTSLARWQLKLQHFPSVPQVQKLLDLEQSKEVKVSKTLVVVNTGNDTASKAWFKTLLYHEWKVQSDVPILERVLEKVEEYLGLKQDTCKAAFLNIYKPGFKHGAFWHIDTEVAGNSVVIAFKPGAECGKGDLIMSRHPVHHAPDKWKSVEGKDEPGDMFKRCRLASGSAIRFCRGTPHMVPAVKRTEERATLNLFY